MPAYGTEGAITDDTQMTLMTVEALRRALISGGSVSAATFPLYRGWAYAQQHGGRLPEGADPFLDTSLLTACRAPGTTCLSGLSADSMANVQSRVNVGSKGCGSVMRAAPFGLMSTWSSEDCYRQAIENAALTHGHDTALASSGALAMIVRKLLEGAGLRSSVKSTMDWLVLDRSLDTGETVESLQKALAGTAAASPTPEAVEALGGGWVADEALAIGVYCALVHEHDPREALLLAVNHGGDSDSTAAIAGSILGAAHGPAGLPSEWIANNEATSFIGDLTEAFLKGVLEGAVLVYSPDS